MSIYLSVELGSGTSDQKAFEEAIDIATKLDCNIKFNHNGFKCVASPNGNVDAGVRSLHANKMDKNKGHILTAWAK
jgi:hypothetical protein